MLYYSGSFSDIEFWFYSIHNYIYYHCLLAAESDCEKNNGGCEQICHMLKGGYACECREGFTLTENRRNCIGKYLVRFFNSISTFWVIQYQSYSCRRTIVVQFSSELGYTGKWAYQPCNKTMQYIRKLHKSDYDLICRMIMVPFFFFRFLDKQYLHN